MGILKGGTFTATRYRVTVEGTTPLFSAETKYRPMSRGQQISHSIGWAPMVHGAHPSLELSQGVWAFQVYCDKIKPNKIRVRDISDAMLETHKAQGEIITKGLQLQVNSDAYDQVYADTAPTTWTVDVVFARRMVFIGTTSESKLGDIIGLLRSMGILVNGSAPWDIMEMEHVEETLLKKGSPHGSRLLYHLAQEGQGDVAMEPEHGSARAMLPSTGAASFSGPVTSDIQSAVDGGAELVSCRFLIALNDDEACNVAINGPAYTMSVGLPKGEGDTWQEKLLDRLDTVLSAWDWLDAKANEILNPGGVDMIKITRFAPSIPLEDINRFVESVTTAEVDPQDSGGGE